MHYRVDEIQAGSNQWVRSVNVYTSEKVAQKRADFLTAQSYIDATGFFYEVKEEIW